MLNLSPKDTDNDGSGDACSNDRDGDGIQDDKEIFFFILS